MTVPRPAPSVEEVTNLCCRYEYTLRLRGFTSEARGESQICEEGPNERLRRRIREAAHLPPPVILRGLLDGIPGLIDAVYSHAREAGRFWADGTPLGYEPAWKCYGDSEHTVKLLHAPGTMRDGVSRSFGDAHPSLLRQLLATVRQRAAMAAMCPLDEQLNIRCIELHHYEAGSGLDDIGHVDIGSTITLSVLLSPPGSAKCGGRFSTIDANGPTEYALDLGDAILFCSEQVHNVSRVREATRDSLVIELWKGAANSHDRYS